MEYEFEKVWERNDEFEFEPPQEQPNWCKYAQEFFEWVDKTLKLNDDSTIIEINQTKLMLQDKYFEWRSFVPKRHRDYIGRKGHTCVYQVYVQAFVRLKAIELSLPPTYPMQPMPPQIGGIFIGDLNPE